MKIIVDSTFLFLTMNLFARTNTEVYLWDVKTVDCQTKLVDARNISNNEGHHMYFEKNLIIS